MGQVPFKCTQVVVSGHQGCLWDKETIFGSCDATIEKRSTKEDYIIKIGKLIRDHLASEWDSLLVRATSSGSLGHLWFVTNYASSQRLKSCISNIICNK